MPPMRHAAPSIPAVALLLAAGAACASDAIQVETRDVAGTSQREAHATAHASATPEAILGVLWAHRDHPRLLPRVEHLEIVRDDGDERVIYQQIAVPIGKNRDVVLRVRKHVDRSTGVIDVRSSTVADEGPPETSRFVRVRTSAGHWHLVPAADGGTDVTYTIRTDGGGGLAGLVAGYAQREAVVDLIRAVLTHAGSRPPPE
jgi:hypothetical protein